MSIWEIINDFYIPRIKWTNDADVLSAQVLNRHQNVLDLFFVNANNNEAKVVLTETDEAYVDVTDNLTFLMITALSGPVKKMAGTIFITTIRQES